MLAFGEVGLIVFSQVGFRSYDCAAHAQHTPQYTAPSRACTSVYRSAHRCVQPLALSARVHGITRDTALLQRTIHVIMLTNYHKIHTSTLAVPGTHTAIRSRTITLLSQNTAIRSYSLDLTYCRCCCCCSAVSSWCICHIVLSTLWYEYMILVYDALEG